MSATRRTRVRCGAAAASLAGGDGRAYGLARVISRTRRNEGPNRSTYCVLQRATLPSPAPEPSRDGRMRVEAASRRAAWERDAEYAAVAVGSCEPLVVQRCVAQAIGSVLQSKARSAKH